MLEGASGEGMGSVAVGIAGGVPEGARVGCMGSVTDVDGNDVMTGEESGNASKGASAPEGSASPPLGGE